MSEERKRILEMLAQGKLTVDETERLLTALGDPPTTDPPEPAEDDALGLGGLEQEIRAGIAEAEAAVASIGSELKDVFGGRRSIRRIRRSLTRSRGPRREERIGERYRIKHEKDVSGERAVEPGTRISVKNGRGNIRFETWDQQMVAYEGTVVGRATSEEEAVEIADTVAIELLDAGEEMRIETYFPEEQQHLRGYWQVDLLIRIPEGADLETENRHGKTGIPTIDGDVSVKNTHGVTRIEDVSGSLRVRQGHGNLSFGSVGEDAVVDIRHGHAEIGSVGGGLTLKNQHGHVKAARIGSDLDLFSSHGNVATGSIGGHVDGRLRHAHLEVGGDIGENVSIDASHGALLSRQIGGDLECKVRHGALTATTIAGSVEVDASQSPVKIDRIGRDAKVKAARGELSIGSVGGRAIIEGSRGRLIVEEANGYVEAAVSRGDVRIGGQPEGLSATANRGSITIVPTAPVTTDYQITANRSPVDIVLPEGSDIAVQSTLSRCEVLCDLPGVNVSGAGQNATLTGSLGDGNASLQITASNGVIRLGSEEADTPLDLDG